MTVPFLNAKISLGNLITIGVLLVGLVGGWYSFETRLAIAEDGLSRNAQTIERLERERDDTRDRLTKLEVRLVAMSETLNQIAAAVGAR